MQCICYMRRLFFIVLVRVFVRVCKDQFNRSVKIARTTSRSNGTRNKLRNKAKIGKGIDNDRLNAFRYTHFRYTNFHEFAFHFIVLFSAFLPKRLAKETVRGARKRRL